MGFSDSSRQSYSDRLDRLTRQSNRPDELSAARSVIERHLAEGTTIPVDPYSPLVSALKTYTGEDAKTVYRTFVDLALDITMRLQPTRL